MMTSKAPPPDGMRVQLEISVVNCSKTSFVRLTARGR